MKFSTFLSFAVALGIASSRAITLVPDLFKASPFEPLRNLSGANLLWDDPGPASDEAYQAAVCKGGRYIAALRGSDAEAGALFGTTTVRSRWQGTGQEFTTWDYYTWESADVSDDYLEFDEFWGVGNALRGLHISDKAAPQGTFECNYVNHGDTSLQDDDGKLIPIGEQTYQVNGRTYRPTDAHFAFAMDPVSKVIIAQDRNGPRHAAREFEDPYPPVPDDQLPELEKSSDIAWSVARQFVPELATDVRYYMSLSIQNAATQGIISRVLDDLNVELTTWPGRTFSMDTDAGKALLATPNAVAIVFYLLQHKAELGIKVVTSVVVFQCENEYQSACLVFSIDDVSAAQGAQLWDSPASDSGYES